jgi:hypothetical protein
MGFPLMVYRGGRKLDEWLIVANEQEQADAADGGYLPLDMRAFMAAKGVFEEPEPEKPQPVLTKKGRR